MIESSTIKDTVYDEKALGFHIQTEDSSGFILSDKDNKESVVPKVGDDISVELVNGSTIKGVRINDKQVFYKTEEDLEREHKAWLSNQNLKEIKSFEENRDKLDAEYEALPKVFRDRIDKFRKNNSEFRWKYESYELFCCSQAVAIAKNLKETLPGNEETFQKALEDYDNDKIKEFCPDLKGDEHSGNTFSCSMRLGQMYYHENYDHIVQLHGALAPLVGSEEYGCIPKKGNA